MFSRDFSAWLPDARRVCTVFVLDYCCFVLATVIGFHTWHWFASQHRCISKRYAISRFRSLTDSILYDVAPLKADATGHLLVNLTVIPVYIAAQSDFVPSLSWVKPCANKPHPPPPPPPPSAACPPATYASCSGAIQHNCSSCVAAPHCTSSHEACCAECIAGHVFIQQV